MEKITMSQVGMITTVISTNIAQAVAADEKSGGNNISAGLFGAELSKVVRDLAQAICDIEAQKQKSINS
jgi:hypothetical protein